MGEDDGAVVDSQLRVRGIDGLRVVDASVMPAMPSPNIHPATIMVAEKGSDIIAKALAELNRTDMPAIHTGVFALPTV